MIKLISIFCANPHFIELQHQSITKNVIGDYEYIIFNSAKVKSVSDVIRNTCNKLGIKCINIPVSSAINPSDSAAHALNESFSHLKNDKVFKIDSDMFFINRFDINTLKTNDSTYIPVINSNRTKSMWSGLFYLDLNKINENIDFKPVRGFGDTFFKSHEIINNKKYLHQEINSITFLEEKNGGYELCYNMDCVFEINKDYNIVSNQRSEIYRDEILIDLLKRYSAQINFYIHFDFPSPQNYDIIFLNDKSKIFHYKSASWVEYGNIHAGKKFNKLKELIDNE